MKGFSLFLTVTFLGAVSWSQQDGKDVVQTTAVAPPTVETRVYKTECINTSDVKMDIEGRSASLSWDRKLEVTGETVLVTKSYYTFPNCQNVLRRHLYFGLAVNGRDSSEKFADLKTAFSVHEGEYSAEVIRVLGYGTLENPNAIQALIAAGSDMKNPKYYADPTYDGPAAARHQNSSVSQYRRTRVSISSDEKEIYYLNKLMKLQK